MTLTITYAGLTLGAGTPYSPRGPLGLTREDGDRLTLRCELLVAADTTAAFDSAIAALDAAAAIWDGALAVTLDGRSWLDLDPAAGTASDVRVALQKRASTTGADPSSGADGPRSRSYAFTATARLPADLARGGAGVRIDTISLETNLSTGDRLRVLATGRASASASETAHERFAHASTGALAVVRSALSSTLDPGRSYDLVREETTADPAGRALDFTLALRARLVPDALAPGDPATQGWSIDQLALTRETPWDTQSTHQGATAFAPVRFRVDARVRVDPDKHPATGLGGLRELYDTTLRPAIRSHLATLFLDGGVPAIVGEPAFEEERVEVDAAAFVLAIRWTLRAPVADLITMHVTSQTRRETALTPRKLWDGQAHTYELVTAGERVEAEVEVTVERLDSPPTLDPADFPPPRDAPGTGGAGGGARWVLMRSEEQNDARPLGTDSTVGVRMIHRRRATYRYLLVRGPGTDSPVVTPALVVL